MTTAVPPALNLIWTDPETGDELVRAPAPGAHYDKRRADRAVRFINNLTHTKAEWAGAPFNLRPWQERIIRTIFGTVWDATGYRQYRTTYMEIPRKNGKSELAAAIGLYLLIGDREPGAEVYSAAVDRDQASLVFNVAAAIVKDDGELLAECTVVDSRRNIRHNRSGSFYRAIPAEAAGRHGYNAHGVIYDEIHAAPNRALYDVLTTSTGARRQPLTFVITTAGWDRNSICYELHDIAVKVIEGTLNDPTFLPILYAAPDDADWRDEAVWHACNPALGDFRSLDEMRAFAARAEAVPGLQNAFRQLYLCQWTEQATRWLDMQLWMENAGDLTPDEQRIVLGGRECVAGLDLSQKLDLTAIDLLFGPDDDGYYDVLTFPFMPADNVRRAIDRDHAPYDIWAREGYLTLTPGNVIDYDYILKFMEELASEFVIKEVAFDPWNAMQTSIKLGEMGLVCVPITQGYRSLSEPTKELEKLLVDKKLRHGGHPVLRWAASNVAVSMDPAGNMKPDKAKSTGRIDPLAALVNALARVIVQPAAFVSAYETRGLELL